jgi:large subunit ribosomal protein L30
MSIWEKKDIITMLGLKKAHISEVHKKIPSVNAKLKMVKHFMKSKPLKLPQGLSTEENVSNMCLKIPGDWYCDS